MTAAIETERADDLVSLAITAIDGALVQVGHRDVMTGTEVTDLLLDLRLLLAGESALN